MILSREVVTERLNLAHGWEAKNRVLLQLARELPVLDDNLRIEQNRVSGCESQVWLKIDWLDGRLLLVCGSDSRVVQGLLVLVLACYQGLLVNEVLAVNFDEWATELGLSRFLTASRGNGLRAIVHKISESAEHEAGVV